MGGESLEGRLQVRHVVTGPNLKDTRFFCQDTSMRELLVVNTRGKLNDRGSRGDEVAVGTDLKVSLPR